MSAELRRNTGTVRAYYRLHAPIYDATRWAFLFGRDRLVARIAGRAAPRMILDVGCGTGSSLLALARRFPGSRIIGVDCSGDMLARAQRKTRRLANRVELVEASYDAPLPVSGEGGREFDLVLFSYSLSMFNPGFAAAIDVAWRQLGDGGRIAVVDFHGSRFAGFHRWMGLNHVRLDGHLLPALETRFSPVESRILPAYGGWWDYLVFVGEKRRTG